MEHGCWLGIQRSSHKYRDRDLGICYWYKLYLWRSQCLIYILVYNQNKDLRNIQVNIHKNRHRYVPYKSRLLHMGMVHMGFVEFQQVE